MPRRGGPAAVVARPGPERLYTIRELAALAGVPASSIHHYRRLGLIPEPVRRAANRFFYDERHVDSLRIVRRLRQRDLSLEEIRAAMAHLVEVRPDGVDEAIDEHVRDHHEPGPRQKLVEAAIDAFATHGYADLSIADLCASADIGKGTFYRYFDSKDALCLASARAVVDQVVGAFERQTRAGEPPTVGVLATYLRRALPVLLELGKRVLQDPGPVAEGSAELFADLATRVGRVLGQADRGAAAQAGGMLVGLSVVKIFNELVQPFLPHGVGSPPSLAPDDLH